eukprot:1752180-Pleurochrysis_carterae.AAC.1
MRGRPTTLRPGLGLTRATYRRMKDGLCSVFPPMVLPPEFRPANQRILDEIAQYLRTNAAEGASTAAAGTSVTAEEESVIVENA